MKREFYQSPKLEVTLCSCERGLCASGDEELTLEIYEGDGDYIW